MQAEAVEKLGRDPHFARERVGVFAQFRLEAGKQRLLEGKDERSGLVGTESLGRPRARDAFEKLPHGLPFFPLDVGEVFVACGILKQFEKLLSLRAKFVGRNSAILCQGAQAIQPLIEQFLRIFLRIPDV